MIMARFSVRCWLVAVMTLGASAACSSDPDGAGAAGNAGTLAGHGGAAAQGSGGAAGNAQAGASGVGSGGAGGGAGAGATGGSAGASGAGAGGDAAVQDAGDAGGGEGCIVSRRQHAVGETGIIAPDGCNRCECLETGLVCTMIECSAEECVTVERLDTCCPEYLPVTRRELAVNPCLREVGRPVNGAVPESCLPQSCPEPPCPRALAPSRVAVPNSQGACGFGDECFGGSGCVLTTNISECCPCPVSTPELLLETNPCLRLEGDATPIPSECNVACPLIVCAECEDQPEPTCNVRDSFSLCQ